MGGRGQAVHCMYGRLLLRLRYYKRHRLMRSVRREQLVLLLWHICFCHLAVEFVQKFLYISIYISYLHMQTYIVSLRKLKSDFSYNKNTFLLIDIST